MGQQQSFKPDFRISHEELVIGSDGFALLFDIGSLPEFDSIIVSSIIIIIAENIMVTFL